MILHVHVPVGRTQRPVEWSLEDRMASKPATTWQRGESRSASSRYPSSMIAFSTSIKKTLQNLRATAVCSHHELLSNRTSRPLTAW
ncbi:hypothetical protein PR202_gb10944 [Eleusine coracana subsp. coracana]|uniref:Uncharacterized protein n=1 Tax=Eleusine coracana subsp. coracana TaxID=191504 RepID=A0AAV5EIX5_ELECO|nr:hypothetical protein PR202_gb10944 [Eleusine coracana subsp. coracana]